MKKNIFLFVLSLFIIACSGQSKDAQNNLEATDISQEQLNLIYEKTKNFPNNTELSIGIVDGDQVTYYGIKRIEDNLQTIDAKEHVFEIGSISKVFTSTLLAQAVVNGKVALDDTILLPTKEGVSITYKQLANHTSGLPRLPANLFKMPAFKTDNPYKEYTASVLETYMKEQVVLSQDPEKTYTYSNLGAGLLGHILGSRGEGTYETLLQEHIFSKYGMSHTTTQREAVKQDLVLGRDKKGEITSNWDMASLKGAGGIVSSVPDLVAFAQAQFKATDMVLSLSRKRTHTIQKNMDIALGWHIIKTKSGDTWHWHNGGTGGYTSSMTVDVQSQKAIIILSNLSAFHSLNKNIDPLGYGLMKTL